MALDTYGNNRLSSDDHMNYDWDLSLGGIDILLNTINSFIPDFRKLPDFDLKMRITSISIPDYQVGTYEYTWHGEKFVKSSAINTSDKTFTITFRVDANFILYKILLYWARLVNEPKSLGPLVQLSSNRISTFVKSISSLRIPISLSMNKSTLIAQPAGEAQNGQIDRGDVVNYFRNLQPIQEFSFQGCFPINVQGGDYDVSASDPTVRTATFAYTGVVLI